MAWPVPQRRGERGRRRSTPPRPPPSSSSSSGDEGPPPAPRGLRLPRPSDLWRLHRFVTGPGLYFYSTLLFALFAGFLHWYHITNLFENDRHFSHLSNLEKEMSFRTEMGLYYSFFKTIIEAPSFSSGLLAIRNDSHTEYPLVINALKRFNVYPEVILAALFRVYRWFGEFIGFQTKTCWKINRGSGLCSVDSCYGMGDPACFYIEMIFILNGLLITLFFCHGTYLSESRLGGFITVFCIFYNHGECTRVMWTPPMRESFSYPFHVLQMFTVTYILRNLDVELISWLLLLFSNISFMISWQFAQYILLTQILCLFALYVIGFLNSQKMKHFIYIHMGSLALCWILTLGNTMLLTSYYAYCLAVCLAIVFEEQKFYHFHENEVITWAFKVIALVIGICSLKLIIPITSDDDANITNLIWSKITDYKDFHTLMYTCAAEFDFIELQTILQYAWTLLLPMVLLVFTIIFKKNLVRVLHYLKLPSVRSFQALSRRKEQFTDQELIYHSLQLIAFAVQAFFIMRLKLFLTPHMCVMASLLCSRKIFRLFPTKLQHELFMVAIIIGMSIQGYANLRGQWSIEGEFSNAPQEELLKWIQSKTNPNAVFAGSMPVMASVKLSAGRPIVIHPHYEDAALRAKSKIVYSVYSRKPVKEVKTNLLELGANYYILEESWCARKIKSGCSMPEIWDVIDPVNSRNTPLCATLWRDSRPYFRVMFQNNKYKVLQIVPDG